MRVDERCRNEVMREDAHDDKMQELGPHRALMQTYLDDSLQAGHDSAPAGTSSVGTAGDEGGGAGSGLPQVA